MDTSILEDLGLTQAEIKVYIALLELGNSSAGNILEKSGLQNSVVHRALNSLIQKSLINYVKEGKRKIYQATDPENFFTYMEEKKRRFNEILPQLKKAQSTQKEREKATIYKGLRGLKEVYNIMINAKGKEYNTFGGGSPCENLPGSTWWLNLHRRRIANKLPARQVFDETVRKIGTKINKLPLTHVKFVSKEYAQFQETVIVGDYMSINVFTKNPYSFLIQDKVVADGYRKQFEILWKTAKS